MKMKRKAVFLLAMLSFAFAMIACSRSSSSASSAVPAKFEPQKNIEAVCTSSPGGGSDMFIRTIGDIMTKKGLVKKTIIVTNQTDGGGLVGRNRVKDMKDDHVILVLNSGDLLDCLRNSDMTIESFTPLCTMAMDTTLLTIGKRTAYKSFKEVLIAIKNGKKVVSGGSRGADQYAHDMLVEELVKKEEINPDLMPFIPYESTSAAITALLGGHIEICAVKPAAAQEYVFAGDLVPIVIYGDTKLPEPFDKAPTIVDLGYDKIEFPMWRSIAGPKNMTPEGVQFWTTTLETVFKSDEWQAYLKKNGLTPFFKNAIEAKKWLTSVQEQMKTTFVGK
jgi:putative tricarboxylic transport membrane protein